MVGEETDRSFVRDVEICLTKRAQIETQLDHDLYQSAWESGQRQRLPDVVTQILN